MTPTTAASGGRLELPPDPGGTIQALTALGYTPEAALADIVDNSIAASARRIDIHAHWAGSAGTTVTVTDNGAGMDAGQLLTAMTLGGRGLATDRATGDLGRYGMGLKTASFSQCRQLTVASRPGTGAWNTATWDIDHVLQQERWQLLTDVPDDAAADLTRATAGLTGPGTVVLWRRPTQLVAAGTGTDDTRAQRAFLSAFRRVEAHLAMVFARYLGDGPPLTLTLNGGPVRPWDPFLRGNRYVSPQPREEPVAGVTVQGYVLPHSSRFTTADGRTHDSAAYERAGGPAGWAGQQGFYVYRRRRLIVAGDWLGLDLRRDDRYNLARIDVDIDVAHDLEWALDVRKASAAPPPALAGHLRRVALATRELAAGVAMHRGTVTAPRPSGPVDPTWQAVTRHGYLSYQVNRDHPLVLALMAANPTARPSLRALLRLIETTLPVAQIRSTDDVTDEPPALPTAGRRTPEDVLDTARLVLAAMVANGTAPDTALGRLSRMPPFDDYPSVARDLA